MWIERGEEMVKQARTGAKRVFCLVMSLALVLGVMSANGTSVWAADVLSDECGKDGDNVMWTFDTETGALTITGAGDMADYEYNKNFAPWHYLRDKVKTVTIGSGVTSIGDYAFYECKRPTSVTIPTSVTRIGYAAFGECSNLTSVTIPSGVTSIGDYAFYNCTSLTGITVSESSAYYSSDAYGVLYNKDQTELIQYPIGNARTAFTIPNGVTSIGDYAFYKCKNLNAHR